MQQCINIFIIPYLYEAQHVSGDTPPIIRSLKLHWRPLVFHTWKAVGRVAGGRCQAQPEWELRLDYGRSPHVYVNQRLQIQVELLMMSGMPLETC
jgi:hypothetical protein